MAEKWPLYGLLCSHAQKNDRRSEEQELKKETYRNKVLKEFKFDLFLDI